MPKIDFEALRELAGIIDGIPEKKFNLDNVAENPKLLRIPKATDCGTVGCAMGWYAMHPIGKAKGLGLTKLGPLSDVYLTYKGATSSYDVAASDLFGLSGIEAMTLFEPHWDVNHKKEFKRRVIELFDYYKQPVDPTYRRLK